METRLFNCLAGVDYYTGRKVWLESGKTYVKSVYFLSVVS